MRFFTVPVGGGQAEEELNRHLASHRVATVDRVLVPAGAGSFWAVAVTTVESARGERGGGRSKVDYKEVLSDGEFAVYARLRSLRRALAEREGVPLYALFTNEQLASMVQRKVRSKSELQELPGVGAARVERYGEAFLEVLRSEIAVEPEEDADDHEALPDTD